MTQALGRSIRCCAFALLWVVAVASHGFADEGPTAREREAKAAFDAGVYAAEAGDYARARSHFLRSRDLVVKASTLLNLALVDLRLGLVDEALFALDALNVPVVGPEHARLLERAEALRRQIERTRAQAVAAPQADPRREGEVVGDSAKELTGSAPALRSSSAHRTDAKAVQGAAPADVSHARAQSSAHARATRPNSPEPGAPLTAPRAVLGVAGALTLGALGSALWWRERSQALDACHRDGELCHEHVQIARQERWARGLTIGLGTTALTTLVAGAIWLPLRKHDTRMPTLSLAPSRESFRVVAEGRF